MSAYLRNLRRKVTTFFSYTQARTQLFHFFCLFFCFAKILTKNFDISKKLCNFAALILCAMISIIVPIYNDHVYLPACLDSLLGQTVTDLQIILVDDESTDNSLAIEQEYAAKDARILLLSQPHAGQSAARNLALNYAKGDYIAFVDADDALERDWSARHLAAIEGVDYVQSGHRRVLNGQRQACQIPKHRYQFTSPCMRLYRRETLQNLQFAVGMIYEDVLFSTDLWMTNASCRILPYAGYLYTLNPQSTTATRHPQDETKLIAALRAKGHQQTWPKRLIIYYTIARLRLHFLKS